MDSFRPLKSPSSERFLSSSSSPPPDRRHSSPSLELQELDIFDSSPNPNPNPNPNASLPNRSRNFGSLSLLLEEPVLRRKPSSSAASPSPSRMIPAQNPAPAPVRHSAPLAVPARGMSARERAAAALWEEGGEEEGMLPPHEIVDRRREPGTAFSVLEGAGRTLKGRDLRKVRNAVWRRTGFLD